MGSPYYPASNPNPFMQGSTEADGLGVKMMNGLINLIGGGAPEDTVDAAKVQDRYNNLRDSVRGRVGDLGYDGDYRPLEVLSPEDFEGDVSVLRAKVDKIDLTAVRDLSDGWKKITERNTTSLTEFQDQIARATAPEVWRGATAQAAAQTVADYQAMGGRVSTASALTGNKIDELLTGLAPTKELVPHAPEHRSGFDNARSWVVGRGWRNDDVAEANAATEARRVLRTVYAQVVHESDANVPIIPLPKPIGSGDGSSEDGTGGSTDGSRGGVTGGTGGQPTGETPGGTQPATTTPDDGQGQDGDSPQPNGLAQDPAAQDTDGTTTPQSSLGTNAAGVGAPGPGIPGGGSPSGGLGSGGLGSGGGAAGGPSPGAALPGAPGGVAAATRAGAGTAAGSSAGRAGMGGMGAPGGARGKGEDEQTKAVPDYLISQENGNELTGLDDLPKTVPPVIGA